MKSLAKSNVDEIVAVVFHGDQRTRNITNFNSYDALNRPQSTTYTVAGTTLATPSAFYTYDADFKGALSSVCATMNTSSCTSPISTTSYTHDAFGRIATSTQTTGVPYLFSYSYSQADQLTHITYPSGRQVNYSLDGVGRVQTVQNGGTGSYYVNGISYTAADGMSSMTMGNGVTQQVTWNDRLQPTNLQANSGANSLLALGFSPCSGGGTSCSSGNNGNLRQQTITAPSLSLTQTYSYDNLNRLTSAVETGGTGWTQNYGYDGNGNRALTYSSSNLPYVTDETPTGTSLYTASNRISTYTYDAAGNVLQVSDTVRSFRYDAENRQVKACNGCPDVNSSPTATYTYDGDGQRVSKTVSGQTTTYVYDAFGNLAAEYGGPTGPTGTQYMTTDHLGSTRLVTDSSGAAVNCYDYLPFGEEIGNGTAARTTSCFGSGSYPVAGGATNTEFTSKERDAETGLDFFGARYNSSSQGRFTSVDPVFATASLFNPQSWNGYTITLNNPFKYVDPSGDFPIPAIIAAVGAGVGGIAGAAGEYLSQRSEYGHIENGWRIVTAAGGGALAGGLAGVVLGTGAAAGVATGMGELAMVGAASNVIGGIVQRSTDQAFGNSAPTSPATELSKVGIDALTGALGAVGGGRLADKLVSIPNVRQQIEVLKFAARRSTRPERIAQAVRDSEVRALANSTTSAGAAGTIGVGISGIRSVFDWFFIPPPQAPKPTPTQACTSTSFNGQEFGGQCTPLQP